MKKKKKKMSVASKTRLFLSLIIFCSIIGSLSYNCYDNIYVLNLIPSKLSNGQYLKGKHILGNDVEIMELSRFEVGAEGQMDTLF